MTESYDYEPVAWAGHNFAAARAAYGVHVGSSYSDATTKGITASAVLEKSVSTSAMRPLVIFVDETDSMGEWPQTIFSKLPYLDHEVRWYLGEDAEICFGAIGDAHNRESYPLQVRPFSSGVDLANRLKELIIERKGGGNGGETYELGALYMANNLNVSPMAEPIVIFIGDEPFFDTISPDMGMRYVGVEIPRVIRSNEVFAELMNKASVYFIQKPYGSGTGSDTDSETRETHRKWVNVLGEDRVAMLPDPNRVVDVIFGILAVEVDRVNDFREEIEGRQKPEQVEVVYKSLKTIHAIQGPKRAALRSGKSVLLTEPDGESSPPLMGN